MLAGSMGTDIFFAAELTFSAAMPLAAELTPISIKGFKGDFDKLEFFGTPFAVKKLLTLKNVM